MYTGYLRDTARSCPTFLAVRTWHLFASELINVRFAFRNCGNRRSKFFVSSCKVECFLIDVTYPLEIPALHVLSL